MNSNNKSTTATTPPWLAPLAIILVILALIGVGRKHDEWLENPLVDLAIITIGVCAFSAVFRWGALKMGSPGLATFFGQAPTATTPITR